MRRRNWSNLNTETLLLPIPKFIRQKCHHQIVEKNFVVPKPFGNKTTTGNNGVGFESEFLGKLNNCA